MDYVARDCKKANKELLENNRPVSVLLIFGKLVEKILYHRLDNFFTKDNVLSKNQYGFRKGHSTVHALHSSVRMIELARHGIRGIANNLLKRPVPIYKFRW